MFREVCAAVLPCAGLQIALRTWESISKQLAASKRQRKRHQAYLKFKEEEKTR